ncbi:MAG: cation:proton antiporter [Opitutaceae bacterium]
MSLFDIAAVLLGFAAALGYLNHRWLRLPPAIGILVIALAGSLLILLFDRLAPAWSIRPTIDAFLKRIDFTDAMLHGMLCFLLFAGALHVQWEGLRRDAWTIGALATLGVAISTAVVGALAFWLLPVFGLRVPWLVCLLFGALISPTDPITVLALLKTLDAPRDLEAKIAGESLFNDGVGVVAFFTVLGLAGLGAASGGVSPTSVSGAALFLLRQIGGGTAVGLGFGWAAFVALKGIDYGPIELLITLALVMLTYACSFWLAVSGPIAVVAAGILIGNHGRRHAMSAATRTLIEAFWGMVDEILTAVLFLLLGLQAFAIRWDGPIVLAGIVTIPIVLAARFVSVFVSVAALDRTALPRRGLLALLTWGGLRGGLSVAMVLSLPPFADKNLLLTLTYAVVVFSVVVQGLSMPRLCAHYGLRRAPG